LKQIQNDALTLVNGGETFSDVRIYSMLPYNKDRILIATREKGLYLMHTNKRAPNIKAFNANANTQLINDQVYGGVAINKNHYAFATLLNGVIIIDSIGNIIQHLNKKMAYRMT